jgi:hypothetical protein
MARLIEQGEGVSTCASARNRGCTCCGDTPQTQEPPRREEARESPRVIHDPDAELDAWIKASNRWFKFWLAFYRIKRKLAR